MNLGAIQTDVAQLQNPGRLGQQQHLDEQVLQLGQKGFAKGGQGVVIGMQVAGDEAEHNKALQALHHAAPYVRKQLGFALNLRHTPALHFVRDTVEEKAKRVDTLLEGIEKK